MNEFETIYVQETKHKVQQYYKVNQIAEIMQVSEKTVKTNNRGTKNQSRQIWRQHTREIDEGKIK